MREYETFYVLRSDAEDVRIGKVREKVTRTITSKKGTLLGFDDWGVRKLAYPIQKGERGRVMVVGYCVGPEVITELERELRFDDVVLRFSTRVLDHKVTDPEARKKGFAARVEAGKTSRADAEAEERERRNRAAERDRERSARRQARREEYQARSRSDAPPAPAAPAPPKEAKEKEAKEEVSEATPAPAPATDAAPQEASDGE